MREQVVLVLVSRVAVYKLYIDTEDRWQRYSTDSKGTPSHFLISENMVTVAPFFEWNLGDLLYSHTDVGCLYGDFLYMTLVCAKSVNPLSKPKFSQAGPFWSHITPKITLY